MGRIDSQILSERDWLRWCRVIFVDMVGVNDLGVRGERDDSFEVRGEGCGCRPRSAW
jgi:hypothetical protein